MAGVSLKRLPGARQAAKPSASRAGVVSSYNEVMDDDGSDDAAGQQPPQTKLAGKAGASDKTLAKIATSSAKTGKAAGKAAQKGAAKAAAAGKAGAAAKSGALGGGVAETVDFSSSDFVEPGLKKPAILVLPLSITPVLLTPPPQQVAAAPCGVTLTS